MAIKKQKKTASKKPTPKTTGHEWDGIKEYTNPDPFWLRSLFYVVTLFAVIYWLLYPSWPTPNNDGALKWTSAKQLQEDLAQLQEMRKTYQAEFDNSTFAEIFADKDMMKFAVTGGESAFNINCAGCHQMGGGGAVGYPNLTDDNWIWGGSVEDIYQTLLYGIRSGHDEARNSQMAAFGVDNILSESDIKAVASYVAGLYAQVDQTDKGRAIYMEHCAICHGNNGEGGREYGAPKLNSPIWLYGGDYDTIYDVIYNGRAGVMPYWSGRLTDSTIRQLSIYVHSLGGGEPSQSDKSEM